MEISTEKSKIMIVGRKQDIKNKTIEMMIGRKKSDQVNSFTNLGSSVEESAMSEKEIRIRLAKANNEIRKHLSSKDAAKQISTDEFCHCGHTFECM